MRDAGIPLRLVTHVRGFDGYALRDCMRRLHRVDPTVLFYNRTRRLMRCQMEVIRKLGISPPMDPAFPWTGTIWRDGVLAYYNQTKGPDDLIFSPSEAQDFKGGLWTKLAVDATAAAMWKKASKLDDQSINFVLMLEDDVWFAPTRRARSWFSMINAILRDVPPEVGLVLVGSCHQYEGADQPLLIRASKWCLHAYATRPRAARFFFQKMSTQLLVHGTERGSHGKARWHVTHGMRVPFDYSIIMHGQEWYNVTIINRARAERDGLIDGAGGGGIVARGYALNGGVAWQTNSSDGSMNHV